jgi:hypothetical protein
MRHYGVPKNNFGFSSIVVTGKLTYDAMLTEYLNRIETAAIVFGIINAIGNEIIKKNDTRTTTLMNMMNDYINTNKGEFRSDSARVE